VAEDVAVCGNILFCGADQASISRAAVCSVCDDGGDGGHDGLLGDIGEKGKRIIFGYGGSQRTEVVLEEGCIVG
jgi:hypothetical protein